MRLKHTVIGNASNRTHFMFVQRLLSSVFAGLLEHLFTLVNSIILIVAIFLAIKISSLNESEA